MKSILKVSVITFFAITNILDFYSTIIQSPHAEENPIIRYVWGNSEDIGFFMFKLIMTIIPILLVWRLNKKLYYVVLLLLGSFILLIALTNLDLIPYSWSSWFNY